MFARAMFAAIATRRRCKRWLTLFGLLYVLWLFNSPPNSLSDAAVGGTGIVTGQFYCFYLIAVTKFSDMARILPAERDRGGI